MDMENGYKILRQISDDDKKADAAVLSIGSQEELKEKQKQWRSLWLDMLGDMPEKTPLQPQITGKIRCEGYTVEKILFQSLPGIYVTGYLYLPDDPRFRAPYPGLLLVNGHSDPGKLCDRYCDMAVMAVKSGFAVFTPDPYSQGERVQRSAKYPWKECAVEHASLGARSWLVGWNFARFRIWDAVRSIDYMETRPELDLSKLAVVGCSGGGTMSTYMQAFDDRIKVACPSCYVSSLREVIGERGVHDAEQFFFGQLPRGFNHAVMLAMGQPRTALMLDARHSDYFPIAGIRSTTALIEKFRDKLGIKTPFALFSSDGSHGWPLCGRTATLSWLEYTVKGKESRFCKNLRGKPVLDIEALRGIADQTPPIPFPEAGRTVTPTGQVRDLPGFKSLYTLIAEEADRLQKSRKIDRSRLRDIVRKYAGIHPLDQLPPEPEAFQHDFKWWYLSGSEGISVEQYAAILAVEGRSLIGERAEMFLRKALAEKKANGGKPVPLRAEGDLCIAAAHAYAAEPQLFSSVEFKNPPKSWTGMLTDPDPVHDSFAVTVWGALKEYDWTDLVPENIKKEGNIRKMSDYYKNKTAWVTGSSRGLGRSIAEKLAEAGCNVIISGRNQTNLRSSGEGNSVDEAATEISGKYGVRCIAVCGELSREEEVERCIGEIHEKMGPVDYLVCAAGGGNVGTALKKELPQDYASHFDLASVKAIFDHNLISTMLCCRAVIPDMLARGSGRIITVGSIAGCGGNKNGNDGFTAYSMAKSTIHQYTRLLAKKLRHDGIPVNCIIPGNINTPSTRIRFGGDREKPVEGLSRLEHVGKPEDIAHLAVFLCGPGGEYISGQLIRVDGAEQLSPC